MLGLPGGARGKEQPANAGDMRHGFDPWVRKIPWRRARLPTPVFLLGESQGPRAEEPGGLQSMGLKRVRHGLRHSAHMPSVGKVRGGR